MSSGASKVEVRSLELSRGHCLAAEYLHVVLRDNRETGLKPSVRLQDNGILKCLLSNDIESHKSDDEDNQAGQYVAAILRQGLHK